jgi:hypothetical protein
VDGGLCGGGTVTRLTAAILAVVVCSLVFIVLLIVMTPGNVPTPENETLPTPAPTPFDQAAALEDHEALTTLPIGSLKQSFIWVRPGEEISVDYIFLARGDAPVRLNLSLERVDDIGSTNALPMPAGLSASVTPARLTAAPGERVGALVTVNTSPAEGGESCVLRLSADADGVAVVADDWLRVLAAESPRPGISGAYHTRQYVENESLVLRPGESMTMNCTIETGEGGGIGTLQVRPFRSTLRSAQDPFPMPPGLTVTVDPASLLVRNHGVYRLAVTVSATKETPPGTYPITLAFSSPSRLSYPVITVTIV